MSGTKNDSRQFGLFQSTAMQTLDSVTNPAVAQSRIGSHGSHTANNSRVMASVVNTATRTTTSTMPQVNQVGLMRPNRKDFV